MEGVALPTPEQEHEPRRGKSPLAPAAVAMPTRDDAMASATAAAPPKQAPQGQEAPVKAEDHYRASSRGSPSTRGAPPPSADG